MQVNGKQADESGKEQSLEKLPDQMITYDDDDIPGDQPCNAKPGHEPYDHGPLIVYQNYQSGDRDVEETRDIIDSELSDAQVQVIYVDSQEGESLEQALTGALDRASDCGGTLVVSGGDGTINAAVSLAVDRQQPLAIIPAGTYNFVARTHGIPEDTKEAVQLILRSQPRATRVGMINDQRFMVNASIGSYARLQRERESYKQTLGRSRTVASLAAIFSALHHSTKLRLRITQRSSQFNVECSTLIFCNNRLQLELVGVDALPSLNQDELVCAALAPVGILTQLAMIWRGWRGRVSETPELDTFLFNNIKVDLKKRGRAASLNVSVDGEACRMTLPLTVKVSDKPLWLICPAEVVDPK